MTTLSGKLAAVMLIGVLVTSVGATPAFADWDKTKYPPIQGTIPVAEGQDYANLSNISLVDAMSAAEDALPDSKAVYGKLYVINGYLVYKVVTMNDDRGHNRVLIDAGTGEQLYISDAITKDYHKNKRTYDKKYNKKTNDYFKGMTPEQVTEKKKQFKEMGDAWKSLSIQDRAAMIIHFMQVKMQWDSMSDAQKDAKKQEMKQQWQEFLPLSPEEKKQKLENYVKSIKN